MAALSPEIRRLHDESPLTDVHAHPSLKAFLFNRNLWRHYSSKPNFDPFSTRTDFRMLSKGRVGVIWSALHLPERELFRQCGLLNFVASVMIPAAWKLRGGQPFSRLLRMMDEMEKEIARKPDRAELAKSVADIQRIRREGKIAVVHTIEGCHVFESNPAYLALLAQRGVAVITLTHFFWNGVALQADGIPSDQLVKKFCSFDLGTDGKPALTDLGRKIIDRMLELDMIVDVTHCAPEARRAIYDHVDGRGPIVATHTGVNGNDKTHAKRFRDDPCNLSDDDIRSIAKTGGAVGVIFYTYWLSSRPESERKLGLDLIWNTMKHIHDITGSWDHVMIGTDFDGMTDPPDDVRDASHFPAVTRMLLDKGLKEPEVKKVLGENALNVLRAGWR